MRRLIVAVYALHDLVPRGGEEALGYATRFVDGAKDYLAELVQHDLAFNDDKEAGQVEKVETTRGCSYVWLGD